MAPANSSGVQGVHGTAVAVPGASEQAVGSESGPFGEVRELTRLLINSPEPRWKFSRKL